MSVTAEHSGLVKQMAVQYGFDYCGIAKAVPLDEDARRLENWLNQGMNGNMHYMENYFDLRIDPSRLVPGARSVITLLKNYYPSEIPEQELKISKYAYGKDYHEVLRPRLQSMISALQDKIGQFNGRGFVDSAPVLERTWARKTGLGWIGKNGNLINKQSGSFYFIATLITDLDLDYDDPMAKDYCGSCTKCIDACPTEAILPGKVINGSKCISYFTIELKDEIIPSEMKGKFANWMFGCDICQDVCPWNRFSQPHHEEAFTPLPEILNLTTKEWEELSEEVFRKLFKFSPLSRSKHKGIQRNIRFLKS
ncbi:tRNA epoxyqueuosine(34) reductase QueG [Flavisolibacter ginsengisoli]|uniref:Epoxyqueuosine reductase n=1 Tax=Flavisolibacter ginsengisoli DSM 18119 TaxID=1121884 RepID=A0A1M5FXX6_9BACT|nr:tRNA epoxyqueuosine(34) reductase QueG [Flavisolibacter ginsengisoli]SHF96313.1 epoxyqueuosine reductase [Flavisolibacter ginsengisoli DSM 18119]